MPSRSPDPPLRVKVYGLWPMTRDAYVTLQSLACVCLLALLALWATKWRAMPPGWRADLNPVGAWLVWIMDNLPWIILVALAAGAVEAYFVLRRFSTEEAKTHRRT